MLSYGVSLIKPAAALKYSVVVLHFAAGLAVCLSALPWFVLVLSLMVVGLSARLMLRRYAYLQDAQSVVAIKWAHGTLRGDVQLELYSGQQIDGELTRAILLPWLLVLGVKDLDSNKAYRVILLPSSCASADAWRHLRVLSIHSWLKAKAVPN